MDGEEINVSNMPTGVDGQTNNAVSDVQIGAGGGQKGLGGFVPVSHFFIALTVVVKRRNYLNRE